MATSKQTLNVSFEYVTPEKAAAWLAKLDPLQRKLRDSKVRHFESMLLQKELKCTHQGLLISEHDTLLDGQHRLQAIVNTGITAQLMVTRGASPCLIQFLDGGTPRTDADRLNLSRDVMAVANCIARFGRPNYEVTISTKKKVMDAVGDRIQHLRDYAPSFVKGITTAPVRAAIVLRMAYPTNKQHAMSQYKAVSIQDYATFCPYVAEFNRQALRGATHHGAISNDDMFIRAWLAFDHRSADKRILLIRDTEARREELFSEIRLQIPALGSKGSAFADK